MPLFQPLLDLLAIGLNRGLPLGNGRLLDQVGHDLIRARHRVARVEPAERSGHLGDLLHRIAARQPFVLDDTSTDVLAHLRQDLLIV